MVKNDSLLPEGNCPERLVSQAQWDQEIGLDLCPWSHEVAFERCHRAAGESGSSVGRPCGWEGMEGTAHRGCSGF